MLKPLSAQTIEAMLAAQDIPLAPGRADRLAPGVNALAFHVSAGRDLEGGCCRFLAERSF